MAASTVSRAFARPGRVNARDGGTDLRRRGGARLPLGLAARPRREPDPDARPRRHRHHQPVLRRHHPRRPRGRRRARATPSCCRTPRRTPSWSATGPSGSCAPSRACCSTSSRMSDQAIRMMAKQKPVIVLNRRLPEVPSILVDNARGVRRAVEHLTELGHDSITYVAGPESSWTDGMRWQALREAADELDIRVRRVGPCNSPTVQAGFGTRRRDRSPSAPTAVIAYNDVVAIGVLKGLLRLGLRVPERRQRRRLRQHAPRRDHRAGADHRRRAAARHGRHRGQEPRRHGRRRGAEPGAHRHAGARSSCAVRRVSAAGRGPRRRSARRTPRPPPRRRRRWRRGRRSRGWRRGIRPRGSASRA